MSRLQATPGRRSAIVLATLALTFEVASLVMYSAAAGFAPRLSVRPTTLLASGPTGAALIRWGSLVDMSGYLCLPPVALYLRDRYSRAPLINLCAANAFALTVIGAMGAVVMAAVAPSLIGDYRAASPAGRQSLELVFGTLYRGVVEGLWQTLETIPAAIWLLGTACAVRAKGPRALFWILLPVGLINAGIAVYRLSGL